MALNVLVQLMSVQTSKKIKGSCIRFSRCHPKHGIIFEWLHVLSLEPSFVVFQAHYQKYCVGLVIITTP